MKISEEDKKLVLEVQKRFPEVWKFIQREANRGTPFEDVMWSLKGINIWWGDISNPWAYLEIILRKCKQRREHGEIDERAENWERTKIQSEEDLKNWLRGVDK